MVAMLLLDVVQPMFCVYELANEDEDLLFCGFVEGKALH